MLLNEQQKPTRQHFEILLMSWAGWVFDFYDLILYTFLATAIGRELHLSKIDLSLVLGASLAATAVGGVLFGMLSDRYGRKAVLQWTILTYSAGTVLCGLATDLWTLLAFRVVTGLGVGGEWATGQTYVCEAFPAKVRGRYGAFMQTGAPIGVALASIVGGFAQPSLGWRGCFFASFLPALLVVAIRKRLKESDVWVERVRSGAAAATRAAEGIGALLAVSYRRTFLQCLVLAVFEMSAYWFTYSWLPGYLQEQRKFTMAKSAWWMLVTQGGGLLGYATFGLVADRIGRRPAFSIYGVLWAVGLWMATLMWGAIAHYPGLILGCMFAAGFGTGMFGGMGPLFSELFPTAIRSTAMGAAFNVARGVQFVTPVLIAVIAVHYGLGGGISLAAVFALLAGVWIWTFPETKGRPLASLERDSGALA